MMAFILATDFDFIAYMSKMAFFSEAFFTPVAFLEYDIVATQGILSSLELRVQFCLLVCCTCPSSSTMNKEKNLIVQRASLQVGTRKHNRSIGVADIGISRTGVRHIDGVT